MPESFPLPDPLPYHREVVALLKETEPELWLWASSAEVRAEAAEEARRALLKANYRFDRAGHADLVDRAEKVAVRLGIAEPVTMYQAAGGGGSNAMLCHLPGEAHIVFFGPILSVLKGAEIDSVIAHELAHHRLWQTNNWEFRNAERLLFAAANDSRAAASHAQSARRFALYTEIYADRGALAGSEDLEGTVAALLKTETGLPEVSVAGYFRQAEEIFARGETTTEGVQHPETFIRVHALKLWAEKDPTLEGWLSEAIEGIQRLDELDLVGQHRVSLLTRRLLEQLLRPAWFQTPAVLAHACSFFADFSPARSTDDSVWASLSSQDAATREYLCYLLLDFAVIDPELENIPLAAALERSRQLGIAEQFEKLLLKELEIGKRALNKLKKEADGILERASAEV